MGRARWTGWGPPGAEIGSSEIVRCAARRAPVPEEEVNKRFFLDWSWWFHHQEPVPHLDEIHQAIWEDRPLRLHYLTFMLNTTCVDVDPYGLVAKAGAWFLVAGIEKTPRVYRISWLTGVETLPGRIERPDGFDLASFWQDWCASYEENQRSFLVTLRVSPQLLRLLPLYFGRRVVEGVAESGPPDGNGWVTLRLSFESLRLLATASLLLVAQQRSWNPKLYKGQSGRLRSPDFGLLSGTRLSLRFRFNAPVIPAAAFATYQVGPYQLAAQGGGILMVAGKNFVDFFFTVAHARLKAVDDITQDGQQLLCWPGMVFSRPLGRRKL